MTAGPGSSGRRELDLGDLVAAAVRDRAGVTRITDPSAVAPAGPEAALEALRAMQARLNDPTDPINHYQPWEPPPIHPRDWQLARAWAGTEQLAWSDYEAWLAAGCPGAPPAGDLGSSDG